MSIYQTLIYLINILDLYYAALPGRKIYKMNISKLAECSLSDSETNEITQLVGTLSGQTALLASEKCVIFFNNIAETSIMCADVIKEINFNMVRYQNSIIFGMFHNKLL